MNASMTASLRIAPVPEPPVAPISAETGLRQSIIELAVDGLPRMFIPDRKLFCAVLRRQPNGRVEAMGTSHRYTMMTLLGLHRLETAGAKSLVELQPVLDELLRDLSWIRTAGDLGNLLWTCAEIDPERLSSLYRRIRLPTTVSRFEDYARGLTTELGWLVTGLALAKEVSRPDQWQFDSLALESCRRLGANQGRYGIFGHLASHRSLAGRLRGPIGSFADQVYPIIALSHFGRVFGASASIARAVHCAQAIVDSQGPLGEWWWHYDSETGRVTRSYPVYSVHQDGMGPMALQALAGVAQVRDLMPAIERGLNWITAGNILEQDMRSVADKLIWRSIALKGWTPQLEELRYMMTSQVPTREAANPYVVYECRPYELGWALYALAGR
jgi:hypothetical protein